MTDIKIKTFYSHRSSTDASLKLIISVHSCSYLAILLLKIPFCIKYFCCFSFMTDAKLKTFYNTAQFPNYIIGVNNFLTFIQLLGYSVVKVTAYRSACCI